MPYQFFYIDLENTALLTGTEMEQKWTFFSPRDINNYWTDKKDKVNLNI